MFTREQRKNVKFSHFSVGNFGTIIGKTGIPHKVTGHATVAGILEEVVPGKVAIYHFGVALCSPEDNFSRQEGRYRAREKLVSGRKGAITSGMMKIEISKGQPRNSEIAYMVLKTVLENLRHVKTPNRWWWSVNKFSSDAIKLKMKKRGTNG